MLHMLQLLSQLLVLLEFKKPTDKHVSISKEDCQKI